MEEKAIIEALADFNIWGKPIQTGIRRGALLEEMMKLSQTGEIVAVIGPRRSGKTTVCMQLLEEMTAKHGLAKEQTLYVNFEDPALETMLSGPQAIEKIYGSYRLLVNRDKPALVVLDEIQNVPRWEKWARVMHEKGGDAKLIVTGSSSKLLSSEISTVLAGRSLKVYVFPLSFAEFLAFRNAEVSGELNAMSRKEELKGMLMEYLEFGGFPRVSTESDATIRKLLLKEYFESVVSRDIMQRHRIKDARLVRSLCELCMNWISSPVSASRMRKLLLEIVQRKISPNMVVKLMDHMESAFLVFFVSVFSYKVKEQKLYPKKAYAIDTGLANAVSFRFSNNQGRLAENAVFIHLKLRSLQDNSEIFYWKGRGDEEVDFVIKRGLKIEELLQVCWDIGEEKAAEREEDALLKASHEFGLDGGTIITWDLETEKKIGGKTVRYIPLWKWLLDLPQNRDFS